jgi:hypothetical protein
MMAAIWRTLALVLVPLSLDPLWSADGQSHAQPAERGQDALRRQATVQVAVTETHERAIDQITEENIPGNRLVAGRVKAIRGQQILIDIGNPQVLYVPLKPAHDKGQVFKEGDHIVVTMNDHNAVVDYHHVDAQPDHQVFIGRLVTSLTVGLDKAVIRTDQGERSFWIASRARTKLGAIPIGVEAVFLADETGQLVDAQLASMEAVKASGENNKANVKGAHAQVRARFKGKTETGMKVAVEKQGERDMPIRPPLQKLDRLQPDQDVVLLVDEEGYVVEIATPDLPPVR